MEPLFTEDELRRIERSAWHYARKLLKEVRLTPPGRGYSGIRTWYLNRAMWHRQHAKDVRRQRLEMVHVNDDLR